MFEPFTTVLWIALAWLTYHAVFLAVRLMFSRDRVNRVLAYCHGALSLGIFLATLWGGMRIWGDINPISILPTYHPYVASLISLGIVAVFLLWVVVLVVAFSYHARTTIASWVRSDCCVRIELI